MTLNGYDKWNAAPLLGNESFSIAFGAATIYFKH